MSQEFSHQIQKVAKDLTTILTKLKAKTDDLVQAKADQKVRRREERKARGTSGCRIDCCCVHVTWLHGVLSKPLEPSGNNTSPLM